MPRRCRRGGAVRLAETMDAAAALAVLARATADLQIQRELLDGLDAEIGDGDHGTAVANSFASAYEETSTDLQASPVTGPGPVFLSFGRQLQNHAVGASGVLYAAMFVSLGKALGEIPEAGTAVLAEAFSTAAAEVMRRSHASPGDATMLDTLVPYAEGLVLAAKDGNSSGVALHDASLAAREGADSTTEMISSRGRARHFGERAVGHTDPGARSFAVLAGSIETALSFS